jgi:hypothetical protein
MPKRQIKVQILPDGQIKFDNAGNPDEQRILKELAELAQLLAGDPEAVKIEKHVHTHATAHTHTHADGTVHTH